MKENMKKLRRFVLLLLCTCLLSGCVAGIPQKTLPQSPTVPPAVHQAQPPTADGAGSPDASVALYLPARDGQHLLCRYVTVQNAYNENFAENVLKALIYARADEETTTIGGDVALNLYGSTPVELSGGVCTVNLGASALQMDPQQFYTACLCISETLCSISGIQYVNVMITGRAAALDLAGILPTGSLNAHPGQELRSLWEQIEAKRTPWGEMASNTPLNMVATLFYPLKNGMGIMAEPRNLSFNGQHPQQLVMGLLSALSAGAQYLPMADKMPDINDMMILAPEIEEQSDGGKQITLYFGSRWLASLRQNAVDPACLVASIVYTLTETIPAVQSVCIDMGGTRLTVLESENFGTLQFVNGSMNRRQFAPYVMNSVSVDLRKGDSLVQCDRTIPSINSGKLRHVFAELISPLDREELADDFTPMFHPDLTEKDLIGFSIEDDTLYLNLSARFAEVLSQVDARTEQLICYSLVNTLCRLTRTHRCRFFFDGVTRETVAGSLYWGGEFLLNPGLESQERG